MRNETDIHIKLLKFGETKPEGFCFYDLLSEKNELNLNKWEQCILKKYFYNAHENTKKYDPGGFPNLETLFLLIEGENMPDFKDDRCKYIINLDSKFKYIDFIELQEARKNAKSARNFSVVAIVISLISIVVALLITQNVRLDNNQFNKIIDLIK